MLGSHSSMTTALGTIDGNISLNKNSEYIAPDVVNKGTACKMHKYIILLNV